MISLRLAFINPKSRIGSQLLMALMVYELQLTPLLVQGSWKPPAANLSICSPAAVVLMSRRAGMCETGLAWAVDAATRAAFELCAQ